MYLYFDNAYFDYDGLERDLRVGLDTYVSSGSTKDIVQTLSSHIYFKLFETNVKHNLEKVKSEMEKNFWTVNRLESKLSELEKKVDSNYSSLTSMIESNKLNFDNYCLDLNSRLFNLQAYLDVRWEDRNENSSSRKDS